MRILLFADTHLGFDHPHSPRTARRRRGPDFLANFRRVLAHARDVRADLVLHGGDLFDVPDVAPARVDEAYAELVATAEAGIPIGIIAGNHERSTLPASLLLRHELLHVFHRPSAHVFSTRAGTVSVVGLPFVRGSVDGMLDGVASPAADLRLLLAHQPFEGATVGPVGYTFRDRPDTVPLRALPDGFDLFLSGHIHRRQVLTGGRAPVVYPGSIERTSFAERAEDKSFVELRWEGGRRSLRHVALPARPMFDAVALGVTRAGVRESLRQAARDLPGDAVVRLRGEPGPLGLVNRALLDSVFPPGVSVQVPFPRPREEARSLAA